MPPQTPQLFFSLTLLAQFSPMATISLILTTAVLVQTQSYALHVICGCSGQTDHLTDNINFVCHRCSREILPAAIASFKEVNIENDSFHVESTFKYLGDTTGQCGGCSDAASTNIISLWKAFRELLPILDCYLSSPTVQSKQNLERMSSTCV